MADKQLTFNSAPITTEAAAAKLKEIYGEKRVDEILRGLKDSTYGCASVAGGYLEWKALPEEPAPAPAPAVAPAPAPTN